MDGECANREIRRAVTRGVLILTALLSLSACKFLDPKPLKPWDRDILARPVMQPDIDPMETLMDEKIYFSKEASRGGSSIGGGGCGCN